MGIAQGTEDACSVTLLTLEEAADRLRISPRTLKRLAVERRVPYVQFGRRAPMFKPRDVDEIVELHRHAVVTR